MTEEAHRPTPGVTWVRMVRTLRTSDAPRYFALNVTLDASVLDRTSRGINAVRAYFVAASSLYSSLRFTNETVTGARTFLEWEGKAFGEEVAGITVFVRNKSGRIAKIRRPVRRRSTSVAGEAIDAFIDVQAVNDLYRLEVAAERNGERFNVAYIGSDFDFPHKGLFSARYMHQLFQYSYHLAKDGTPWHRTLRD